MRHSIHAHGLAKRITTAFCNGTLKIKRPKAPIASWEGMPEVYVTTHLRNAGASDTEIRLFLTFTAAMDRARDADALWRSSEKMFMQERWVFHPREAAASSHSSLADVLKGFGVSRRHKDDVAAWKTIAGTLLESSQAPQTYETIYEGQGNANVLLKEVIGQDRYGKNLFPLLRGPKIRVMWVRMLAWPGGAVIANIDELRVAVDVQVRKVTEYLRVTNTIREDLEDIRDLIQQTWAQDVKLYGAIGPKPIADTSAALDPALWFFAKWGCTHCEESGKRIQIDKVCGDCCFDSLRAGGRVPKRGGRCS
jgi:hypothetical protein